MATRPLPDAARPHRRRHRPLDRRLMQMMPPDAAGLSILIAPPGGEHPLPGPRRASPRILGIQTPRDQNPTGSRSQVTVMQSADTLDVPAERIPESLWSDGHPVLPTLPPPDSQLTLLQI